MENARPPPFKKPQEFLDSTVQSFLQDNTIFLEKGLNFAKYIPIKCVDGLDVVKSNGIANFVYLDKNTYWNSRKIFLEADVYVENTKTTTPTALKQEDFVSAPNPFGL